MVSRKCHITKSGFIALALCLVACKPKTKDSEDQPSGRLDVPEFDFAADPFTGSKDQTYQGQSLIFSHDSTAESIRSLLDGSTSTRRAKAQWLSYDRDVVQADKAKVLALTNDAKRFESDYRQDSATRLAGLSFAKNWINGAVIDLRTGGVLSSDIEEQRAKQIFASYCDAKVWELALSTFATASYKERPTPLAFCEDYFVSAGFYTSAECLPSVSGKSYFKCLWQDGLMRTTLFASHYDIPFTARQDERKKDKIATWVADGTLQAVVRGPSGPQLLNAALAQDRLRVSSILGRDYKDVFVPDLGIPTESSALPLEEASPGMLLTAMEDGPTLTTPPSLLLNVGALSDSAKANVVNFHKDLRAFAQRALADISVSDFLFWQPTTPYSQPAALQTAQSRPSLVNLFALSPALSQKLAEMNAQKATLIAGLEAKEAQSDVLFGIFSNLLREGAITASKSGVTDSLWINSALHIEHVNENIRATFQIDGQSRHIARLCLTSAGEDLGTCLEGDTISSGLFLDSALVHGDHDTTNTKLTLEMQLEEPETFGFQLNPGDGEGSGDPFSNIDPSSLRGKLLHLEIFPNRIGDVLYFYSGKLQILDENKKVLHVGAINLLN